MSVVPRTLFASVPRGLDEKTVYWESIILWFFKKLGMRSDDQEYLKKGVTLAARGQ